MRTRLIIGDQLIARARELTGIHEKTALVRAGLEALVARETGKRLALLGGTQPKLSRIHSDPRLMPLADRSLWMEHVRMKIRNMQPRNAHEH